MNDRAMQILTFIEQYTSKEGRPPTIRDIGVQFEIASTNGVRYYLDMLEKSDLLRRAGKTSRGLLSMRQPAAHPRSALSQDAGSAILVAAWHFQRPASRS